MILREYANARKTWLGMRARSHPDPPSDLRLAFEMHFTPLAEQFGNVFFTDANCTRMVVVGEDSGDAFEEVYSPGICTEKFAERRHRLVTALASEEAPVYVPSPKHVLDATFWNAWGRQADEYVLLPGEQSSEAFATRARAAAVAAARGKARTTTEACVSVRAVTYVPHLSFTEDEWRRLGGRPREYGMPRLRRVLTAANGAEYRAKDLVLREDVETFKLVSFSNLKRDDELFVERQLRGF